MGLTMLACGVTGSAEMPDYLREALRNFGTQVPPGWAYTLTTVRNGKDSTTARFDPARPPAERWILLHLNGRPPTAREAAQYSQALAAGNSAAPQGTFQKEDIDPASFELLNEDADRAEFHCGFRDVATGADKMLGHLTLRLTASKHAPRVEKFVLELTAPYSPVLGVKMRELRVEMNFSPSAPAGPCLPSASTSHFLGRIFLIGVEEDLALTYSDFERRE